MFSTKWRGKIEPCINVTNGGSKNFQSHFLVGIIGMTNWIRESVIIMAIGQNPQVYLHSVRRSTCATYRVRLIIPVCVSIIALSPSLFCLSPCLQSLFLPIYTCAKADLQSYTLYGTLNTPSSICRNICAEKSYHLWTRWWCYNVPHRWEKPVCYRKGF